MKKIKNTLKLISVVFLLNLSAVQLYGQENIVVDTTIRAEERCVIPGINVDINYLTKWTDISLPAIGNSIAYEADNRIVIDPFFGEPNSREALLINGNIGLINTLDFKEESVFINWGNDKELGRLMFKATNTTVNKTVMTLNGVNGYIGIGTETPASLLHLFQATKPQITLADQVGNLIIAIAENNWDFAPTSMPSDVVFKTHNTNDHHGIIFNINDEFNDGSGYIKFNDNLNHNTLTILNNGRVGIGLPNPAYTFQVKGTTFTNEFILFNDQTPPIDGYILQTDERGYATWVEAPQSSPWLPCGTSDIHYSEGNVGIGTTNTAGFKLAVNGNIMAELIKVVENVPASDYVFQEDYKLMPLYELEMFVNKNQHLPEVKSAKEFKEEGYNVGDMDDVLLRKVEELTLYTIAQQKQIDEQKKMVDVLIQQVMELNQQLTEKGDQ